MQIYSLVESLICASFTCYFKVSFSKWFCLLLFISSLLWDDILSFPIASFSFLCICLDILKLSHNCIASKIFLFELVILILFEACELLILWHLLVVFSPCNLILLKFARFSYLFPGVDMLILFVTFCLFWNVIRLSVVQNCNECSHDMTLKA